MPMTTFKFEPGQKCMVEMHAPNHPNGAWEGVIDTVAPYDPQRPVSEDTPPLYLVTARFTDPHMRLEAEGGAFASYYGKPVTADATLWPIETRRLFEKVRLLQRGESELRTYYTTRERALFDTLRQRLEDERDRSTYYVAREEALLDALQIAGKEQILGEALQAAVKAAVKAAVQEAFAVMPQRPSE